MSETDSERRARRGFSAGLLAYVMWGLLPIYFHALREVPPLEVVAHRIIWSALLLLVILYFRKGYPALWEVLTSPRLLLPLIASATLIGGNWLLYIWAVQNGYVLGASLGYFLNPVINVVLGFALLRERLSAMQWLAIALAGAGVAIMAAGELSALLIALALAFSFAFYGLIRKLVPTGPMVGLAAETIILAPIAVGAVLFWSARGELMFPVAPMTTQLLLIGGGAVTATPLLLFAFAAQRLRLTTLGILQYVAPTMQLLLGVLLFGEPLTATHKIAFPLIWVALMIYSWALLRQRRG